MTETGAAPPSYKDVTNPQQKQPPESLQHRGVVFQPQRAGAGGVHYHPAGYPPPQQQQVGQVMVPQQQQPVGQVMITQLPMGQLMIRVPDGPPPDYLKMSMFVTIFCCIIFGGIAVFKSYDAKQRWLQGDAVGAHLQSSQAKMFNIYGVVFGVLMLASLITTLCIAI